MGLYEWLLWVLHLLKPINGVVWLEPIEIVRVSTLIAFDRIKEVYSSQFIKIYEKNNQPAAGNALLVCASFCDCVAGCGCGDGAFAGA